MDGIAKAKAKGTKFGRKPALSWLAFALPEAEVLFVGLQHADDFFDDEPNVVALWCSPWIERTIIELLR